MQKKTRFLGWLFLWTQKDVVKTLMLLTIMLMWAEIAQAADGLPWETPLQKIGDSLNGPVAKIVGVCSIILTGLALAFGEAGGIVKKILQIVFGLTIAFTAATFFASFFGFTGGSIQ